MGRKVSDAETRFAEFNDITVKDLLLKVSKAAQDYVDASMELHKLQVDERVLRDKLVVARKKSEQRYKERDIALSHLHSHYQKLAKEEAMEANGE